MESKLATKILVSKIIFFGNVIIYRFSEYINEPLFICPSPPTPLLLSLQMVFALYLRKTALRFYLHNLKKRCKIILFFHVCSQNYNDKSAKKSRKKQPKFFGKRGILPKKGRGIIGTLHSTLRSPSYTKLWKCTKAKYWKIFEVWGKEVWSFE